MELDPDDLPQGSWLYSLSAFSHARKRAMMLLPNRPAALQIGEPKPLQLFIGRDHHATRAIYTHKHVRRPIADSTHGLAAQNLQ
jgi:hypothetical protein